MEKLYQMFPKGKRRQLNFYSPSDAFLTDQSTPKNNYKYYQFDYDWHSYEVKSDLSKQDSNDLNFDRKNFLKLNEIDSEFSSLHSSLLDCEAEEKKCSLEKKNKSRKNLYVINISNSKYFHIGPQKTISINEKQLDSVDDKSKKPCVDIGKLLDCEEKLTEECITLISLHLHDRWREFVKYLGLEDTLLEVLELRNDNNKALIIYDALQEYMNLFPNTSLGFVVHTLSEIHQVALIERLAQELSIDCK